MPIISYKCPNCSGVLKLEPESQTYECEYCLSRFNQDVMEEIEKSILEQTDEKGNKGNKTYICPSCAAQIVSDDNISSMQCYYCHSTLILSDKLENDFAPDAIIPFKISERKAREIFKQWISKKRFLPKYFYKKECLESLQGVYFPYYVYSCDVDADALIRAEKDDIAQNNKYRETYNIKKSGTFHIAGIAKSALSTANADLASAVQPFLMEELVDFNRTYLAGFIAQNKDMDSKQYITPMEDEVETYTKEALISSVSGYNDVDIVRSSINISKANIKYALFPIWAITYKSIEDGRIYYFSINGQSGKTIGELPIDKKRLISSAFAIFLLMFFVLLILAYFI